MKGKYLYCIAKELEPTRFSTAGIEGASVHAVNWQELSCVVSDTDFGDKELSEESALAHEKVLEEVMQHSPIVPIAFGHIAKSEDEIKSKLLEVHKNKLEEWLAYLQGKIELSLKAFWLDLNPVLRHIAQTSDEFQRIKAKKVATRNDQMVAGEIGAKLMGKKREEIENGIISYFENLILEHKKCNLFGEQMITNLAFLINQGALPEFDRRVNECAEKLGDNVKLKSTGPVPPYNFVDLKINFTKS